MLPFNGAWEGALQMPALSGGGYVKYIINCKATGSSPQTVVTMSSDEWDYYNMQVNSKMDGDHLVLWWNDDANRMTLDLALRDDGRLDCTCSQYGDSSSGILEKTSDTPVIGISASDQKMNAKWVGILSQNNDFNRADSVPAEFTYNYSSPSLAELKDKYGLGAVAGDGSTQERALNLMKWLCAGISHISNDSSNYKNSIDMLDYAYNQNKGLNCKNLSITLSEMCLSVGIQARALWLYPQTYAGDNHVVVMVWLPETGRWIMIDPSFDSYLSDNDGNILSPGEVRDNLAAGVEMKLNPAAEIDYMGYCNYLAKDMFYFTCVQDTKFGTFEGNAAWAYLAPNGFDLPEWLVRQLEYLNTGDSALTPDQLTQREKDIREASYLYATPDSFWGK